MWRGPRPRFQLHGPEQPAVSGEAEVVIAAPVTAALFVIRSARPRRGRRYA